MRFWRLADASANTLRKSCRDSQAKHSHRTPRGTYDTVLLNSRGEMVRDRVPFLIIVDAWTNLNPVMVRTFREHNIWRRSWVAGLELGAW